MTVSEWVESWPAIIQGALGSALFAAALYLGQRITRVVTSKMRKDKETAEFFALMAWSHKSPYTERSSRAFFTCIYAALHYFLKAMIIFCLVWLLSPLGLIISSVGYLIALYFLFSALSRVPHLSNLGDVDARLDSILAKKKAGNN